MIILLVVLIFILLSQKINILGYGFIKDCDYLRVSELLQNACDYELINIVGINFLYKKLKILSLKSIKF